MDGFAADDAAERDRRRHRACRLSAASSAMAMADGISSAPGTVSRSNRRAGLLERARRAGQQRVGDVVIEARLDDQDARFHAVGVLARRVAAAEPWCRCPFRRGQVVASRGRQTSALAHSASRAA